MLPKRLTILPHIPDIVLDDGIPYIPKDDELYTYDGIPVNVFWIKIEYNHFHVAGDIKEIKIIWLLAELDNNTDLHMVTSSPTIIDTKWILEQAGIKFERRASTRQIDESNKTTNSNNSSNYPISDSWLARFWNWIRSILHW